VQGGANRRDAAAEQRDLVIKGVLTHHLEILGLVRRRCLGVLRVKGVGQARALDRALLDAVHGLVGRDAADLEEGGDDINDVAKLLAERALVLDMAGPGDGHALANAAELRGVLLELGKGRIKGPGPARRHVVVGLLRAPDVIPPHLFLDRHLADAVEERDFVGCAERPAFGAGAIVAVEVDDQRVVKPAHVLDGLDNATDLVVAVSLVDGKDLDLLDE
jgi:hypothetical protein